jgi:hypothetical protein
MYKLIEFCIMCGKKKVYGPWGLMCPAMTKVLLLKGWRVIK